MRPNRDNYMNCCTQKLYNPGLLDSPQIKVSHFMLLQYCSFQMETKSTTDFPLQIGNNNIITITKANWITIEQIAKMFSQIISENVLLWAAWEI